MKKRNNKSDPLPTTIKTGSPKTAFTQDDLRRDLKTDLIFLRPYLKNANSLTPRDDHQIYLDI